MVNVSKVRVLTAYAQQNVTITEKKNANIFNWEFREESTFIAAYVQDTFT